MNNNYQEKMCFKKPIHIIYLYGTFKYQKYVSILFSFKRFINNYNICI